MPKSKPSGMSSPGSGAESGNAGSDNGGIEVEDDPDTDAVVVSRAGLGADAEGDDSGVGSGAGPGASPLADVLMGRRPKGPGRR